MNKGDDHLQLPDSVFALLDAARRSSLQSISLDEPEELRFRIGQRVMVSNRFGSAAIQGEPVNGAELDRILERAVKASFYAHREELQRGFLFVQSGVRIGICGSAYNQNDRPGGIRSVTSVAIRIPHAFPACADSVYPYLIDDGIRNTLVVSPPGGGKTTLLRALIRRFSQDGIRVAVADERGELAASSDRHFAFDLGANTDVMTGGRKAETATMLLRAMNPQILAFDEITAPEDLAMMMNTAGCGTALLATAHGCDQRTMMKRPLYRRLFSLGIFERLIMIRVRNGSREYIVESL